MRLHRDFPEIEVQGDESYWSYPDPYADIAAALNVASTSTTLTDIAAVERYHIASHGVTWEPGSTIDSELELVLLGRLGDGRWFGLEAWNDYTGWGCGEGADFYVGDSEDDVILNGLTQEGRAALAVAS